jgi:CubicO group peptidase (beta-lactamase class C family)
VAAAQPSGVEPRASAAPAVVPAPRQKPTAQLFDDSLDSKGFFPRGDAFELGLDGKALDELVSEAERTKSDALIVLKNGQVVAERRFGQRRGPIETMSITKSITALAVTMLIEGGKIASLDEPVSKFIAEFGAGEKRKITLRHLLTQSSGLAHGKDARALNAQKDRTAYALRGKVVTEPGGAFSYNNEATQLLSIVVEKAAGKPIDAFLDERLFRPLGIRGWQWDKDGSGNVQTYYGLALDARDLARIGQMLLDGGRVGDKQLISKEGITKLHAPSQQSPYYGLLWWIRYERVVHEFDQTNLAKLESVPLGSMAGKTFGSAEELWLEAGSRLSEKDRSVVSTFIASGGKLSRERPDQPIGFYADGSLGQRLAIFGAEGLVVVRQRRRRPPAEENEGLSFPSMLKLAHALTAR